MHFRFCSNRIIQKVLTWNTLIFHFIRLSFVLHKFNCTAGRYYKYESSQSNQLCSHCYCQVFTYQKIFENEVYIYIYIFFFFYGLPVFFFFFKNSFASDCRLVQHRKCVVPYKSMTTLISIHIHWLINRLKPAVYRTYHQV